VEANYHVETGFTTVSTYFFPAQTLVHFGESAGIFFQLIILNPMKTNNLIKIIVIALFVVFSSIFSVYAASPAAAAAGKAIRQRFVSAVTNPDELQNILRDAEVEVLFTINEDGTINIKKIEGNDDDVSAFVKEKISVIPCKDFVFPNNQYYRVKFRFETEQNPGAKKTVQG
jgi:hypothetical protein